MGYDYEINYKKAKDNLVVDTLSCAFDAHVSLSAITMPIPTWLHSVQQGYVNDSSSSEIIQPLASHPSVVPHFSWEGSSLRYKGHLVLPQSTDIKHPVFYELHSFPLVRHSRFMKTYERVRCHLFWKGMQWEIQHMVSECAPCQHHQGETTCLSGFLEPLPIPTRIWTYISMDFIQGLPKYGGKIVISGMNDFKFLEIVPVSSVEWTTTVDEALL